MGISAAAAPTGYSRPKYAHGPFRFLPLTYDVALDQPLLNPLQAVGQYLTGSAQCQR
jgi:hypothetical protein